MTFRIIFYSLFFLGKVPLLRMWWGDFVLFCLVLWGRLSAFRHLAALHSF